MYNPDQIDSNDDGIGDVCPICTICGDGNIQTPNSDGIYEECDGEI
jgi:hypothetical protein